MSLEKRLSENMIRFGVKNLSWMDKFILAEQDGIKVGSKSGQITVGKKAASGGVDTEADSSNYDIPFATKDGAWWVAHLAKNGNIPYEGYNITPSIAIMEKLMDPVSLQNWKKLLQDPQHVKQGVAAIAYFSQTNTRMKWTNIFVGNEEFVQRMKSEGGATDWQADISLPLSFPQNPNAQYFEDNTAILTEEFKKEVEWFIRNIKEAAVASKVQNPEFYLIKMGIATSSSRFRNTGPAENLTWLQLSEQRAKAAQDYIIQTFTQAGIIVGQSPNGEHNTTYEINPKGANGDGSSGPNPPDGFQFNTDGRGTWTCGVSTNDSSNPQVCTWKNRDEFGAPKARKDDYDQFKYLIVSCELVLKNVFVTPGTPKETPDTSKEITGNVYSVEFYRKQKGVKFPYWYPTVTLNFGKPNLHLGNGWDKMMNRLLPGQKKGKDWGSTKCWGQ